MRRGWAWSLGVVLGVWCMPVGAHAQGLRSWMDRVQVEGPPNEAVREDAGRHRVEMLLCYEEGLKRDAAWPRRWRGGRSRSRSSAGW